MARKRSADRPASAAANVNPIEPSWLFWREESHAVTAAAQLGCPPALTSATASPEGGASASEPASATIGQRQPRRAPASSTYDVDVDTVLAARIVGAGGRAASGVAAAAAEARSEPMRRRHR